MTSSVRPEPFSAYTTPEFWDDPHISEHMLRAHLDPDRVAASRDHAFIDRSAAWLRTELGLHAGSRLLDLGCGPGLCAIRLARSGIAVVGVDVSARALDHARAAADREVLPVRLVRGNYLEADLGADHDAAIMIYEDYSALSPVQRGILLGRVRDSLRPGGSFLFDVTSAAHFAAARDARRDEADLMDGFWAPRRYRGVHETWTYPDLRLVLDRYTIHAGGTSREFWNWTHCLTPAQVDNELSRAGFEVVAVHGDVAGSAYDPEAEVFAVQAVRARPVTPGGSRTSPVPGSGPAG